MQSLRARLTSRAVAGTMAALRRQRQRQLGIDVVTPDLAAELFEQGALEVRAALERATALTRTVAGVRERQLTDAPLPTWLYEPVRQSSGRTVLYLHGGAYVAGSHLTHRGIASALARVGGAHVVLPEYRLAPEHLFPAPVEDALTTYRWLLASGTDPGRLVLAGDSAGGGLAVATALAARDEGLPRPAGILGLSPWVDLTASGASIEANDELDPWLDGTLVSVGGAAYAPGRTTDPLASPLFADHADLPPMLVHVGTHEVLLDDARRIVESARAAGVPAELGEFEGMWHVFQAILGLPETTRSLREAGGWIRRVTDEPASAALSSLVGVPAHRAPAPPPDAPPTDGGAGD